MASSADLAERALRRLGVVAVDQTTAPDLTATVPLADLARQALEMLGVIAADETPAPADDAATQARLLAIHDGQVALGHASWLATAIPRAVAEDYIHLAAVSLAPAFGKQSDPARTQQIELRIRQKAMIARAPALAEQAILDVHALLDARGKARWSLFDIPDYADNAYVLMAANLLAPQFGLTADPAADLRAMRDLQQVIALPTTGETVRVVYF